VLIGIEMILWERKKTVWGMKNKKRTGENGVGL
jgi:hypothetical protein